MRKLIIVYFILLASCDYAVLNENGEIVGGAGGAGNICSEEVTVNFEMVKNEIFVPRCFNCHGNGQSAGGVSLETHQMANSFADRIASSVDSGFMPIGGSLSPAEKDMVAAWVAQGAQNCNMEGDASLPSPNPVPTPTPDPEPNPIPEPDPEPTPIPDPGDCGDEITFAKIKNEVFVPKCFNCHGNGASAGGINLETYASTRPSAFQIKSSVESGRMPRGDTLTAEQKAMVSAWVDNGAPETCEPSDPTQPPPPPINEPITEMPKDSEINYSLIREKVFKLRCFSCHSNAGGNADGLNLETYFNTIDELEDIQEEVGEGSMPPPPRTITNIERQVLLRWIRLGAPR